MPQMEAAGPLRLVAGLGNPGGEYAGTRHNIGFAILDELARRHGCVFEKDARSRSLLARWEDVFLLKPQTWMNLSGEAVGAVCRFFKIAPEQVLVVYDDAALPLGRLRLRPQGSAGGHNGLASIIQHLGTDAVPRLRAGIGAPTGTLHDHVLSRFRAEEQPLVEKMLGRAADAVQTVKLDGLAAAMNSYNTLPTHEEPI